jgi:hypothetical protein
MGGWAILEVKINQFKEAPMVWAFIAAVAVVGIILGFYFQKKLGEPIR